MSNNIVWIAIATGAWVAYAMRRRAPGAAAGASAGASTGGSATDDTGVAEFAGVSPKHYATFERARRAFLSTYALTFEYRFLGATLVEQLFANREEALTALGEVRLRLPNDLDGELRFVRAMEAADRGMMERIDEARARMNAFVHPGPKSAAHAAVRVRAIDDVVE